MSNLKIKNSSVVKYKEDLSDIFPLVGSVSSKVKESKKIVLCFLNRTGSNYYAELMSNTNLLGYAKESLNQDILIKAKENNNIKSLADYFDFLYESAASDNNVFSFQVGMHQLYYLLSKNEELKIFDENTKFLYITRSDIVMQTISFYKASITKSFTSYHKGKNIELHYDEEKLLRMFKSIVNTMMNYEYIFSSYGLIPHRVNYESLIKSPKKTIRETLNFIETNDFDMATMSFNTKLKIQRDELSYQWLEKLRDKLKAEI